MQIKDLILKTEKVNWQELKDLQPSNLKVPYHNNILKESLIKNNFAMPIAVWQDTKTQDIYICDGHTRRDVLIELKNDGYEIPVKLTCNFLDLPNRKEAVKKLLEVYNTKKNPIDESAFIDWRIDEGIEEDEIDVDWLDMVEQTTEDYSDKNKEVDLEDLRNESSLVFKFDHQTYLQTLDYLDNAKEKLGCNTNEETLLKLLSSYE